MPAALSCELKLQREPSRSCVPTVLPPAKCISSSARGSSEVCAFATRLSLSGLMAKFKSVAHDKVHSYVASSISIDRRSGRMVQNGSGPNLQGDRITLCTCKHRMRASVPALGWQNRWIAGFSSRTLNGQHWLFYLAQVKLAYESQFDLWQDLPTHVRQTKAARYHRLGDIYEPHRILGDENQYEPGFYHPPILGHSHRRATWDQRWQYDIDYRLKPLKQKPKRKASLLSFDPAMSFVWYEPTIRLAGHHSRQERIWASLSELADSLE